MHHLALSMQEITLSRSTQGCVLWDQPRAKIQRHENVTNWEVIWPPNLKDSPLL
jgi:hypothetical protein